MICLRSLPIAVIGILLFALTVFGQAGPAGYPYLLIKVIDQNGELVRDAVVRVTTSSGPNVLSDRTDETGKSILQFNLRPTRDEVFTIRAVNLREEGVERYIATGGETGPIQIIVALKFLGDPNAVTVNVVDQDGKPLKGAAVTGRDEGESRSNSGWDAVR